MDIDQHLMWYISALKASVDGDAVDDIKLIKNVSDCFLRVKKACSTGNKEQMFEDFRVKATLLLLLCCPRIQELPIIQNSRDFQTIVKTLPVLKENIFFSVVRSQKNYRFLAPILCWVSPRVLQEVTREYFICTDAVTPVTLAIALELTKGLLFSCQHSTSDDDIMNNMESLTLLSKFLSSKNVSDKTEALIKSSGYYYLYLCEFVHLMLTVYAGQCLKEPDTYPDLQAWTSLWKNKEIQTSIRHCTSLTRETVKSLLDMCHQNCKAITIAVWTKWYDFILPVSVTVHRKSLVFQRKDQQKRIQSVICNIAFDILSLFDSYPEMSEPLKTSEYKDLLQFFTQVQSDPDYDPDEDLSLDELVKEINLKDEYQEKLLGILIKREDIFMSQVCQGCLKEHGTIIDNETRQKFLLRFIQFVKAERYYCPEWLDVVLNMATDLPSKQILEIIENHLAAGLDETLKMADFNNQLTAVFNQLAGEDSVVPSGKHVWLCLQSGKSVVEHAVRLPVSLTGLVPVIVQALTAIPQVCQAILPSGTSLLVATLVEQQKGGLFGKEEQEFVALVKGLLHAGNILAASDVMQMLVEPLLRVKDGKNLDKLALPLELLKDIVEHEPSAVIKPGPTVISLLLTLAHTIQATVNLQGPSLNSTLSLRSDAITVLKVIADTIIKDPQKYNKDISLLKQLIMKYKLHPRCILPLSQILDAEDCRDSITDQVLCMMMKMEFRVQQGEHHTYDNIDEEFENLAGISRSEWIIALLQVLPYSTESEWTCAIFFTHNVLQSKNMVYPTLQAFQEVLYLLCVHLTCGSLDEENKWNCDEQILPVSLSIQHCFKCFASGAVVYIEKLLQPLPCDTRFKCIASIFKWWCRMVSLYQCNPELPSLLLARLCSSLEELIASGSLKVSTQNSDCAKKELDVNEMDNVSGEEYCHLIECKDNLKDNEQNGREDLLSFQNGIKLSNGYKREELDKETSEKVIEDSSSLLADSKETPVLKDIVCKERKEIFTDRVLKYDCEENSQMNIAERSDNSDNCSNKMKKGRVKAEVTEINSTDFKKEIEDLIFSLVKYVPTCNLVASVASKLKKLYEL